VLVRSFESLDIPLAWRRVRTWAQSQGMDVPDRLPYEVLDRLYGDEGPSLRPHHEPGDAVLVISSKKSGTFRPFVRVRPTDLILYQALLDQLAPAIESALPPIARVGAYRQSLSKSDYAFAQDASSDEFQNAIRETILATENAYVLETDISGYFLSIRLPKLQEVLLESSDRADIVYDLVEMLALWQGSGVQGLPQGVRPSSPLGNLYLASLDRLMGERSVPTYRWMDDMWAVCESYSEARRTQDLIEQHLYGLGLTLNGEKTRIVRAATAATRLETAALRFQRRREAAVEDLVEGLEHAEYVDADDIPDDEEIDRDVIVSDHERLTAALQDDSLPDEFQADMGLVYRQLRRLGDPHGLADLPRVLVRAPDLSATAMEYAASLSETHPAQVGEVFSSVLSREQFVRDFEKLNVCHKALSLNRDAKSDLDSRLAALAANEHHPLIRAKALLAWGLHSKPSDFSVVDRFLTSTAPQWRVYALVCIQRKSTSARDERYDDWAGQGGGLGRVVKMLKESPIRWSKL
jgi:hypothetical protein